MWVNPCTFKANCKDIIDGENLSIVWLVDFSTIGHFALINYLQNSVFIFVGGGGEVFLTIQ